MGRAHSLNAVRVRTTRPESEVDVHLQPASKTSSNEEKDSGYMPARACKCNMGYWEVSGAEARSPPYSQREGRYRDHTVSDAGSRTTDTAEVLEFWMNI